VERLSISFYTSENLSCSFIWTRHLFFIIRYWL
jgi:hypothetical protein